MRLVCGVLAFGVLVACGSTRPPPARPQGSTVAASEPVRTRGLALPKILSVMPEGRVIDLGPVLVPKEPFARERPHAVLLAAADRLGADAFVFESRAVGSVYRIRRAVVRTWRDRYTGDFFETRADVYDGAVRLGPTGKPPSSDTGYYRAIRRLTHEPSPCAIDSTLVGEEVARLFEEELPLEEQVRMLNVLFAQGLLERGAFQAQRLRCLDQLDREERELNPP